MTALLILAGIGAFVALVLYGLKGASDSWAKQWQRIVPFRGTINSSASVSRPESDGVSND